MKTDTYRRERFNPRTAFRTAALLAIGAAAWSCAQAAPPTLATPYTQSSVVVKLADLDLTTEQGNRVAYERIRAAAKQACNFTTHMGDYVVGAHGVYTRCYDTTMASAIKQVGRTPLVALHDQMSRTPGH